MITLQTGKSTTNILSEHMHDLSMQAKQMQLASKHIAPSSGGLPLALWGLFCPIGCMRHYNTLLMSRRQETHTLSWGPVTNTIGKPQNLQAPSLGRLPLAPGTILPLSP